MERPRAGGARRRLGTRREVVLEMGEIMPGPVEVVWDLITDWEHQDDWMLEASDFVVVSQRREGVGVEAEATIKIGGISTRDRIRVVSWEPFRRLGIEHLGWVSGRGDLYLTPVGRTHTHVFWREELVPPLGAVGAAGMVLFKPVMGRIFRRDLRILVGLVRASAAPRRG
ncbi:MAG TPA: SRPBCC family protein [Actinomycetota bacterium]|nr:SRPBCC family protein [Actinomycetota bacterium]